ncbi:MAG: hypothetical protein K2P98_02005, partial [Neisseriaceae bacterium]|nr:hypothetical protein [Neisseriaceae bacterium]
DGSFKAAKPTGSCYYMSGAFTHRLLTPVNEERLTICLGAPWQMDSAKDDLYSKFKTESENVIWEDNIGELQHSRYARDHDYHKVINASEKR